MTREDDRSQEGSDAAGDESEYGHVKHHDEYREKSALEEQ